MRKTIWMLAIFLVSTTSTTPAQSLTADGKATVKQLYDQMKTWTQHRVYLNYTVAVTYSDGEAGQQTSRRITLIADSLRSYYQTDNSLIVSDRQVQATVLKQKKKVILTDAPLTARKGFADEMTRGQDVVFEHSQLLADKKVVLDGQPSRYVMLKIDPQLQKLNQVRQIEYWMDEAGENLKKVRAQYVVGHPLRTTTMTIHNARPQYHLPVFEGTALAQVILSSGQLTEPYRQFELNDLRNPQR